MIDLLIVNITYVAYRLLVSAHIVKFFNQYVNYYWAVLIMSQVSFAYDNGLFAYLYSAQDLPRLTDLIAADIMYTLRVFAAWVIIKWLWEKLNNYYVAVFIGAELTFVVDYFIFKGVY
jgi:hypothetical protein